MNRRVAVGIVLVLGGIAIAGTTWVGYQRSNQAKAEHDTLIAAMYPSQPKVLPKFYPPTETGLFESSSLRAYCESGDAGVDPELVENFTGTLQDIAIREDSTVAEYKQDVVVSETARREFACELVRLYGSHQSFDNFSLAVLLRDHVNEGAIDW